MRSDNPGWGYGRANASRVVRPSGPYDLGKLAVALAMAPLDKPANGSSVDDRADALFDVNPTTKNAGIGDWVSPSPVPPEARRNHRRQSLRREPTAPYQP